MQPRKHLTAYLLSCAVFLAAAGSVEAQKATRPLAEPAAHIQNDSIWLVGQVMDLDAQVPIANARIEVDGQPCIRTNQEGKFFVRGTRYSKYTVDVRAMGYEPHSISLSADNAEGTTDVWLIRASGHSNHSKRRGVVKQFSRDRIQEQTRTASKAN